MACAIDPTGQQLRDACARMSRRFGWVESFEAVMQDARRSRLVRLAVAHPSAAETVVQRRRIASARPVRPTSAAGSLPLDRKRAAAGERDDD